MDKSGYDTKGSGWRKSLRKLREVQTQTNEAKEIRWREKSWEEERRRR